MRNLYGILILLVLIIPSCVRHSYPPQLITVDSLCSTCPDSALHMLDSMKDSCRAMDEDALWYYRLLCVKAADKAYIKHTSPKEINEILNHYENGGDSRLLPEAYFYAGSVYRDLNDAPQAVEYFQKALEHVPDKDLRMKSRIYNQIGQVFMSQGLTDMAVSAYKEAYKKDALLKDTANMIYSLRDIGYAYNKKAENDSCEQVFRQALVLSQDKGDKELERDIQGQIAGIYVERGKYREALMILDKYNILADNTDKSAHLYIAAAIYMGTEDYDKAEKYCDSLRMYGNIHAKRVAYKHLMRICSKKKEYEKVSIYSDKYEEYCDSVERIRAQEAVANIHAIFNYNLRTKEIARLKAKRAHNLIIFASIISFLSLCTCIALYILHKIIRRNERQKELFHRLRRYQYEMSQDYRKENLAEIHRLEQQISTFKDKNHELVIMLEEQRTLLIAANKKSETDYNDKISSMQRIYDTVIYKSVLNKARTDKPLSDIEWEELDVVINNNIKNFRKRLYDICKMSSHEYNICMLIRLDLKMKDIAVLVGRSSSAITMVRKRLHTKILGKSGNGNDFDEFVKSL